ncbi:MAG: hypothetical protein NW226_22520 [Microscillaceae bacterium]|nr:hypothetical protein [Microscillaceae bacterium]
MKKILLLILVFITFQSLSIAQTKTNAPHNLINELVSGINHLPLTNIVVEEGISFQSKYSLNWNAEKQLFILTDTRFKPHTAQKLREELYTEINPQHLHSQGVLLKSFLNDQQLSLQLFTAKNDLKIFSSGFMEGAYIYGMYYDRFTLGKWDSAQFYPQLKMIQETFKPYIEQQTDWKEEQSPDFNAMVFPQTVRLADFSYVLPVPDLSDVSIHIPNSTANEPALFLTASQESENKALLTEFLLSELENRQVTWTGEISGVLIISKTGLVENFQSFNLNKTPIEKEVKNIILGMPNWKPAKHQGRLVKVNFAFSLKK